MAIRIENTEENQFDFMLNLLTQQDEVISKLDDLNVEIEALIEQLANERKAELGIEADAADISDQSTPAIPLKKAA